jgi:hypothetical protein
VFSKAYELASGFTKPVLTSVRFSDNSIESSLGSFVILNEGGWIITAGHILNSFVGFRNQQKEISKHNITIKDIQNNPTLLEQQKLKKISQLKKSFEKQRRIINHSFWWGADNLRIEKFHVNFEIDLAIGRLSNLPKGFVNEYPKIINPEDIKLGTSLCKLGYPFYNIRTTWNSKTNGFELDPKIFPIPRFPLEGMYTRNVNLGTSKDKKYEKKFIETSSPGLRGQSGGPIFDVSGRIWAIQSQTISLPLGFSPKLKKGNKETIEHQFINVGLGVHTKIIVQFLNEFGVKFEMS